MNPSRRALLSTVPLAALLAACATTAAQAQTDADLIAAGIQLFAPILAQAVPSMASTINAAEALVVSNVTALGGVLNKSSPAITVTTIVHEAMILAPIAIKYLPNGSLAFNAANAVMTLLPAVLSAAGIAAAIAGPAPVAMSGNTARALLRGLR